MHLFLFISLPILYLSISPFTDVYPVYHVYQYRTRYLAKMVGVASDGCIHSVRTTSSTTGLYAPSSVALLLLVYLVNNTHTSLLVHLQYSSVAFSIITVSVFVSTGINSNSGSL